MNKRNTGKPGIKPDDEERLFRRPSGAAVARYILLPGIVPRIQQLYQNSFSSIAYLIAVVYHNLGLIPAGHPFANPGNIGRYGVRHVVALAADNLVIDKRNMDKIILFLATLLALVLIAFQVIILFITMTTSFAWAGPGGGTGIVQQMNSLFITENPDQDIAFRLLDQVFAIPGLFNSADAPPPGGIPPINSAMHEMFELYNYGVLFVGGIIFLYYIMVVVFETAQTGVPFGRRFDNVWVPIRLVVAIGLLLPINYGLNSAQYISLYVAKLGSSFATNTWFQFNQAINESFANASPLGYMSAEGEELKFKYDNITTQITAEQTSIRPLVAQPEVPFSLDATRFGLITAACIEVYDEIKFGGSRGVRAYFKTGDGYLPVEDVFSASAGTIGGGSAAAWRNLVVNELQGNVVVRIGYDEDTEPGEDDSDVDNVMPVCGEWNFPLPAFGSANIQEGAPDPIFFLHQSFFTAFYTTYINDSLAGFGSFDIPRAIGSYLYTAFNDDPNDCDETGIQVLRTLALQGANLTGNQARNAELAAVLNAIHPNPANCDLPSKHIVSGISQWDNFKIAGYLKTTFEQYLESTDASLSERILGYGWGGAGIWYNKIAEINGNLISAARAVPEAKMMPALMEGAASDNMSQEENVSAEDVYCIKSENFAKNKDDDTISEEDRYKIAKVLCGAYKFVQQPDIDVTAHSSGFGQIAEFVDWLVGGSFSQLYDIRKNAVTHPLAQVSAAGKSLIEASMASLKTSVILGFGGGVIQGLLGKNADNYAFFSRMASGMSGFFTGLVFITLTGGVILYFIVPLMPFLYFFFAVAAWVMSIFEAMVGVPLWALAHLRLEGKGFIPQDASQGYLMLMEILLRPVLIVFGLVATSIIFFTQLAILHSLWDLVISNAGGAYSEGSEGGYILQRGPIDKMFFTVMYIIVIFLIATTSFKLIDAIPNQIMRWFGAGVTSFAEQAKLTQAIEQTPGKFAVASFFATQQLTSSLPNFATKAGSGFGSGVGSLGGAAYNRFMAGAKGGS